MRKPGRSQVEVQRTIEEDPLLAARRTLAENHALVLRRRPGPYIAPAAEGELPLWLAQFSRWKIRVRVPPTNDRNPKHHKGSHHSTTATFGRAVDRVVVVRREELNKRR